MQKAVITRNGNSQLVDMSAGEITERNALETEWTNGAEDRAAKAERKWRDEELAEFDKRMSRHLSEVRQGLTPTETEASLDAWAQSLRDMPSDVGFPNSHSRPTRP
jgi:hypothetical protein